MSAARVACGSQPNAAPRSGPRPEWPYYFLLLDPPPPLPAAAASAFFFSAASCFARMISAVDSLDLRVEFAAAPEFRLAARSRSRSRWLPRVIAQDSALSGLRPGPRGAGGRGERGTGSA